MSITAQEQKSIWFNDQGQFSYLAYVSIVPLIMDTLSVLGSALFTVLSFGYIPFSWEQATTWRPENEHNQETQQALVTEIENRISNEIYTQAETQVNQLEEDLNRFNTFKKLFLTAVPCLGAVAAMALIASLFSADGHKNPIQGMGNSTIIPNDVDAEPYLDAPELTEVASLLNQLGMLFCTGVVSLTSTVFAAKSGMGHPGLR